MMENINPQPDLFPAKGRYDPGEGVSLILETPPGFADEVVITCLHLNARLFEARYPVTGERTEILLPEFHADFLGLGIRAELYKEGVLRDTLYTAADISVAGRVARYGFLSDFGAEDASDEDVASMAKYHINLVQFYDWSYRHDQLVPPTEEYQDMMGKRNSLTCVRRKIEACHSRGMGATAYAAVYAASRPFWEEHRDWGLYALPGKPLVFINTFYFMNIAETCPWHDHIIGQYQKAMDEVGFDGIHMDTYGYPKTAQNASGELCELKEQLPRLIEHTAAKLRAGGREPRLVFNNVGAWPVEETMRAPVEAVYMEVWPPYERLHHLKELILKALPSGKPVVLAAYPAPFRLETEERALYGALMMSFVIAASGATQLFLGEENGVLTQGYYADHSLLTRWQSRNIRDYQDFFVRYQELLFDRELSDVSMTHLGGENLEYCCDAPFSAYGEPDKLWLTLRENRGIKLVAMLNLCGNNEDYWNHGKEKPRTLHDVTFQIQVNGQVDGVWCATPDAQGGEAAPLPFSLLETERGRVLRVTVPTIEICALLWFRIEGG
jgi:dextranase